MLGDMTTSRRLLTTALLAVAACLGLAACGASTGTTAGGASATGPTTPAATSAPTTPPPTTPATSPATTPATTPAGAATTPPPLRSTRCTAAVLSASLGPGGGGAAGSTLPDLVLTNTGSQRCTLQGWPGVSFVGDGNGTQLGAAGQFDRSSPHGSVTLDPGASAHAPLRIAQALNYPQATCQPAPADGLRVYPPDSTHALFVATSGMTACRSTGVNLITIQAVLPGA